MTVGLVSDNESNKTLKDTMTNQEHPDFLRLARDIDQLEFDLCISESSRLVLKQ